MRVHYQVGGALQRRPWGQNNLAPWQHEDGTSDEALRDVYEANAPIILETGRQGPIQSIYNFPLTNEVSINQIMDFADTVFQQQHHAFRLNLVFGVILRNRETGQYRYFIPYTNNGVLERALYVSRRADLERLRVQLQQKDITTELLRNRPDTKWIPVLVTNVRFPVWSTHYPIGQGRLPDYLLKKDSLYPLVKNRQTGKLYDDNLCAFRCLALHRGHDIKSVERPAHTLYRQWMANKEEAEFGGLTFDEFPEFERHFGVNLEVYSLEESGFARSLYKSRGQHDSIMYVNLFENHMSYIRDFATFSQKYQCQTCDRHFKKSSDLHRHQRTCTNKTNYVFPGGFHRMKESIFEELDKYGIDVPKEERTFPWFICYDFEAILKKVDDRPTEMLTWTHQHVPISVSICSNVEGHRDPTCLVDPDANELVKGMVSAMSDIANTVYELAEEKWGWVLEAIDDKISKDDKDCQTDHDFFYIENMDDDEVGEQKDDQETKKCSHPLQNIYGRMETYMTQVPVLGFNSSKYDLNLIKRCLAKHLEMHEDSQAFVVKKDNAYACIATDKLKFLDMSQYLAVGSSYAGFLKAYQVSGSKGHFPYEWFDSTEKLDYPSLPAHDCFYSDLKGINISEVE
ncbi:MAG: C2H2-type zinc finger protein, partial [Candidatus Thiodiazotropha sp.]